jgi:hypothetical protein
MSLDARSARGARQRIYEEKSLAAALKRNKCSTTARPSPQFSHPVADRRQTRREADAAGAQAQYGRRPRRARPPLRAEEQVDWIRGIGDFLRRKGTFCVTTGRSCAPATGADRSNRSLGPPADALAPSGNQPIGPKGPVTRIRAFDEGQMASTGIAEDQRPRLARSKPEA